MLSHDNLTWDAQAVSEYLEVETGKECIVSYLPLSHVAAQVNKHNLKVVVIFHHRICQLDFPNCWGDYGGFFGIYSFALKLETNEILNIVLFCLT